MSTPTPEIKDLLAAGLHFGHKTTKWNPKMKPFIYGAKNGVHVFDLTKTADCLVKACAFLEDSAAKGKVIMLVSTKQQTTEIIPAIAMKLGLPFVTEKWYGGFLTNWETTKSRIKHLRDLKAERDATAFKKYVKSERNKLHKEIERLELWYAGVEGLERRPDVIFILDVVRDKLAAVEARHNRIPVVAIADSNADPDLVTHPIPGNDDAVRAIDYVLTAVSDAIERGQQRATEAAAEKPTPKAEKTAPQPDVAPAA